MDDAAAQPRSTVPVSGCIQLALNVGDLGESIAFYSKLFGTCLTAEVLT
jgi:predicted enzyme related to lactoylglutathione lyase